MATKNNATTMKPLCSVTCLFISFTLLCILSLSFFFFSSPTPKDRDPTPPISKNTVQSPQTHINVYVAELPRSLNYGLLEKYWSSEPDSRIPTDPDHPIPPTRSAKSAKFPQYPENPLIKQYSAEYWIMGDLETPQDQRSASFANRVFAESEADVNFVPFFATLSTELELGMGKGTFKKKTGNEDYRRQREVLDFVKNTEAWNRSGGRDHVFVLTGYVKP